MTVCDSVIAPRAGLLIPPAVFRTVAMPAGARPRTDENSGGRQMRAEGLGAVLVPEDSVVVGAGRDPVLCRADVEQTLDAGAPSGGDRGRSFRKAVMERIDERRCGLDVHRASVSA